MEGNKFGSINTDTIDNGLKRTVVHRHGTKEFLDVTDHEAKAYAEHIKAILPKDVSFDHTKNIYGQLRDGIVLSHFLNHIDNGLVNLNRITKNLDMEKQNGLFEASTNLAYIIKAAKKCGICVVNLGPEDILYENRTLVLGLLWQLVKKSVTKASNITTRPELVSLLKDSETLNDITNGGEDRILLRWINYHLERAHETKCVEELRLLTDHKIKGVHKSLMACVPRTCTNFGPDLRDSKIYLLVLKQVASSFISDEAFLKAYIEENDYKRAESVVKIAEILGCKRFITPEAIIAGDNKLNFLFMATIFDKYIGLSKTTTNNDITLKKQIEMLNKEKKEMSDRIRLLQVKLDNLVAENKRMEELQISHSNNIEARKEIYERALLEHDKSLEEFSNSVLALSQNLGYVYNNEDNSSTDKIMFAINALHNELDKLKIENRELRQMNVIIDEIYIKLESKIEECLSKDKKSKKGCLDIFFCK